MNDELAGIGHNQRDIRAEMVRDMDDILQQFEARRAQFLKSAAAAVVRDRGTAGDAADLIKLAGKVAEAIEIKRREITDPLRTAAEAVKAKADDFWEPVTREMTRVLALIDSFDKQQTALIEQQQREQEEFLAKLAGETAPPPPPEPAPFPTPAERLLVDYTTGRYDDPPFQPVAPRAAPRRIKGNYGATVVKADEKTYEVTDLDAIPRWLLETATVKAAIAAAAKAMAKQFPVIPGITVTSATNLRIK